MANSPSADSVRSWVEQLPDVSRLHDWRPLATGNSRGSWTATLVGPTGRERRVVVRADLGNGPMSGTPLDIAREATAYRALAGSGTRIPELLAADRNRMVIAHVPGSTDWTEHSLGSLLPELGRLHRLPAHELDLPGWSARAADDLHMWAAIADGLPPDPFLRAATGTLLEHFPGEPPEIVLCHGDAGPGNVLFGADGTTTALLDWEFTHLGDPMDDLAWVAVRARLFGVPLHDFASAVRTHYPEPVDPVRFRYWRAVVVWRNLICCAAALAQPEGANKLLHIGLVPALRALLVAEIGEFIGAPVAPPPTRPLALCPPPPDHDPAGRAMTEIAGRLRELEAGFEDAAHRLQTARIRVLVDQLARSWGRVPPSPAPTDTRWTLDDLAGEAARGLALFPRAARIVAEPLADLE